MPATGGNSDERAYQAALNLIKVRDRSVHELTGRLRLKQFDAPTIDALIGRLISAQLLDDQRFAASWVRGRISSGRSGPAKVSAELKLKGVATEIIDQALRAEYDEETELAKLSKLIARSKEKDLRRITRYLLGRGFSYSTIRKALAESIISPK